VTNTGQVAGSDVAQLYLGDSAAAGEPPRQLKGFQKVTLKPASPRRCASFLLLGTAVCPVANPEVAVVMVEFYLAIVDACFGIL